MLMFQSNKPPWIWESVSICEQIEFEKSEIPGISAVLALDAYWDLHAMQGRAATSRRFLHLCVYCPYWEPEFGSA